MAKYIKGELHANGETLVFETSEETKSFRLASDMHFIKSTDGTKEYGFSNIASMFAVLEIDTMAVPLGDKPNCDNYGKCPGTPEPNPEP